MKTVEIALVAILGALVGFMICVLEEMGRILWWENCAKIVEK